ncbi:MAG: acyl-CoA thioesterase, partial [Arenibacterium sp.]
CILPYTDLSHPSARPGHCGRSEHEKDGCVGQVFETEMVVGTTDCDALGHMNVAQYFALCNRNGFAMQTAMGWPPGAVVDGLRLSFAVVKADCNFVAEVLAGERVRVQASIARIGTKSAVFRNDIVRLDASPVFASTWQSACLNLDTRKAQVIPDNLRTALERFHVPA